MTVFRHEERRSMEMSLVQHMHCDAHGPCGRRTVQRQRLVRSEHSAAAAAHSFVRMQRMKRRQLHEILPLTKDARCINHLHDNRRHLGHVTE